MHEKKPGLFRKLMQKIPLLRSLKTYIFVLMLAVGIIPSVILRMGILQSYE